MVAPAGQVTAHYQTFQSAGGHLHNIHEYLVGMDIITDEEKPIQLATSWNVDSTGRNWTFKLREGVPFYLDGKASDKYREFTSKDVRHTWEIMAGKKNKSDSPADWLRIADDASAIELINDHEVLIHHKLIDLEMPFVLSEEWTFGITSLDYWNDLGGNQEAYQAKPMGTGAFSFVEKAVNQHMLFKANENHWRKTPDFDELQFLWVPEAATRVAQIIAGEAHIVDVPRDSHDQLTGRGLKIYKSTLPGFHVWIRIPYYQNPTFDGRQVPNHNPNDPVRDVKVREALNLAINRNALNNQFLKGKGLPDPVEYFPPWREDCKDEWAPYPGPEGKTGCEGGWPYPGDGDPERARELLAEAGYPNGFQLRFESTLDTGGLPEMPDIAESIAAMWENIGIDIQFEIVEAGLQRQDQQEKKWTGSVNLTRYSLDPISLSLSFSWYENPRGFIEHQFVTDWKRKYDQTIDLEERLKMSRELGDWWKANHVTGPLFWVFPEVGVDPKVVEDYTVNQLHFGPVRYHEYTKAVFQ
jgi:peptide/nickel transport system substrate-binding protein